LIAWGCNEDESCTDFGCASGVVFTFAPAIAVAGRYSFTVGESNSDGSCDVTVPLTESVTCADLTVDPNGSGGIAEVTSAATSSLTISVQRDGELLTSVNLQPTFENTDPDQNACSDNCLRAYEVVTLP
jgi:hypothetical protein